MDRLVPLVDCRGEGGVSRKNFRSRRECDPEKLPDGSRRWRCANAPLAMRSRRQVECTLIVVEPVTASAVEVAPVKVAPPLNASCVEVASPGNR